MYDEILWQKCIDFHGHECPGLAIGYAAAMAAREILECSSSKDEELVCVAENDACGVDALQVILGCSVGKGNLLMRVQGKQVFTVFNRNTQKSVRLSLKNEIRQAPSREKKIEMLINSSWQELFCISQPKFEMPENARIFNSQPCALCNELTAEFALHVQAGKLLCGDCFAPYSRGW